MKNYLLAFCLLSPVAFAGQSDAIDRAVEFNRWYVSQIAKDIFPITDGHEIDKFVTASTMKKLRHTQEPGYGEDESNVFYDSDLFIKAQDIGEDWPQNINAVAGDSDPVCINVYVAFGKKQDHIVIDCMIKENGTWKVQSVAAVEFSKNLADLK